MQRSAPDGELHELSETHWPLLGTFVDLRITAHGRADAIRAERIICDEISRLERVFSVFDDTSMLQRWTRDSTTTTSNEFDELLSTALRWQRASGGAFNVSIRQLWNLWSQAARDGNRPSSDDIKTLVDSIRAVPYRFDGYLLQQVGDCTGIDLNAIAKGFIVDVAADAAWSLCDLVSMAVSAGGDIIHRGHTGVRVGIEDPTARRDDAPPLHTITLSNAAVATSGPARRGVSVGGEWTGHLLDPRTGRPARGSASVTVLAPDATTADVVATIVSVMDPGEGLGFVDSLAEVTGEGPVECWIVDRNGGIRHTRS